MESRLETYKHIDNVRCFISVFIKKLLFRMKYHNVFELDCIYNSLVFIIDELLFRAQNHDKSKLEEPEVGYFNKYMPKLKSLTFGTDEYFECLKELKPALDHHYNSNRHHPEAHDNGLDDMNLIDLIEMYCDWEAAVLRHDDGDIRKSLKFNSKRFNMSQQLVKVFENTIDFFEFKDQYSFKKISESAIEDLTLIGLIELFCSGVFFREIKMSSQMKKIFKNTEIFLSRRRRENG